MRRKLLGLFVLSLAAAGCVSTEQQQRIEKLESEVAVLAQERLARIEQEQLAKQSQQADPEQSLQALDTARTTLDAAVTPSARARAVLAECSTVSASAPADSNLNTALAGYVDVALGQALLAGDKDVINEAEQVAISLLQRTLAGADVGISESVAEMIVGFWKEAGVIEERAARLETGAATSSDPRAERFLLGAVRRLSGNTESRRPAEPRAPQANKNDLESLLSKARNAWDEGGNEKITGPAVGLGPYGGLLPVIRESGDNPQLPGQVVEACFEQILSFVPETAAAIGQDRFKSLRERAAKRMDESFWRSMHLFLSVRAPVPEAGNAVDAEFDEYLGSYPASTWALRLLVRYYESQNQGDPSRLAARVDGLAEKLPAASVFELAISVARGYSSAGKTLEAISWFERALRSGAILGTDAVSVLVGLAGQSGSGEVSHETRAKVAGLIRSVLSEPGRVPVLRMTELRQLKASLANLESRKSSS